MLANLNTKLFNLNQLTRQTLNLPPALCHYQAGRKSFCPGCEPGQTFECEYCHRLMPWCMGAADAFEDACDNCWSHLEEQAMGVES